MVASIRYLDRFVKQDEAWLFAAQNEWSTGSRPGTYRKWRARAEVQAIQSLFGISCSIVSAFSWAD
jgi:hypothetical protein